MFVYISNHERMEESRAPSRYFAMLDRRKFRYKRCLGAFKWNFEFGLDLNRITRNRKVDNVDH